MSGPSADRPTAGVDVGGTSLRVGRVDGNDSIVASDRAATPPELTASTLARLLKDRFGPLLCWTGSDRVSAMGLALPGILDDTGVVRRCVHLPGLEGDRPADAVADRLGIPVLALTDADAAALGEYRALPPPRPRCMVHLRLGTGVACSSIVDGQPAPLERPRRGHLSILVVDSSDSATPCPCGRRGCLETIASGRALERSARDAGLDGGLSSLRAGCERRDATARDVVCRAADAVVAALRQIAEQLDPACMILGGGVVNHLPVLADETMSRWTASRTSVPIHSARRGDDAGILGAAAWVRGIPKFDGKQSTP